MDVGLGPVPAIKLCLWGVVNCENRLRMQVCNYPSLERRSQRRYTGCQLHHSRFKMLAEESNISVAKSYSRPLLARVSWEGPHWKLRIARPAVRRSLPSAANVHRAPRILFPLRPAAPVDRRRFAL